ncbi:MAG: cysteine desulfurase family protein [Sphingomonadaceae bacterium]
MASDRETREGESGMIYLDYQATTPLAPEARAAMLPYLGDKLGNPHSAHRLGREASAAVELARERVGAPFGGGGRLIFTSGATEALNLAIKGSFAKAPPGRTRIVTVATEHAAVLDTVGWLAGQGADVVILPVGCDGLVDLDQVAAAIDDRTALVAVMMVNNEIGVIQPVAEIAAMARAKGALMLCDAVQGYGRVPLPVESCDMIAISAHKIHGPKGIGALWVRDGVALEPQMHGGGQEAGLRSGTLAPALCAGFGVAADLMARREQEDAAHVETLWCHAHAALGEGWTVNGSVERRYRGNLNIRQAGLDVGRLISDVREVALSAGSACASGSGRPSHVLRAIGLSDAEARSSIRLGFGRYTSVGDIENAIAKIRDAADQQRSFAA